MTRRILAFALVPFLAACAGNPPAVADVPALTTIPASAATPSEGWDVAALAATRIVYPRNGEGWAALVARECVAGTDYRTQVAGQRLWYGYPVTLTCAAPAVPSGGSAGNAGALPGGQPAAAPGTTASWVNPLTVCHRISSNFGWRNGRVHQGVDLATPVGTPVKAAAAGTVYWSNDTGPDGAHGGGGGWMILVAHAGGVWTSYHHLSKRVVPAGKWVAAGTVIAYSGGAKGAAGAGNSTGPHLHFQVMPWGRGVKHYDAALKANAYTNPVAWMAARGVKVGC